MKFIFTVVSFLISRSNMRQSFYIQISIVHYSLDKRSTYFLLFKFTASKNLFIKDCYYGLMRKDLFSSLFPTDAILQVCYNHYFHGRYSDELRSLVLPVQTFTRYRYTQGRQSLSAAQ